MCTVQAPHWAMPRPYLVPVRPTSSRIAHNSGVLGSTSTSCAVPLMVRRAMPKLLDECDASVREAAITLAVAVAGPDAWRKPSAVSLPVRVPARADSPGRDRHVVGISALDRRPTLGSLPPYGWVTILTPRMWRVWRICVWSNTLTHM